MQPLTETEREAIDPFLELCAEREIPTAWKIYRMPSGWYLPPNTGPVNRETLISWTEARREQYNNLCYIGMKELLDKHSLIILEHPSYGYIMRNIKSNAESYVPQLPDCDLAAITAAMREVE